MNEGKAAGWRGGQRDAPAVGGQDNTTASHMWAKGGVQAVGAAHSGIVTRGGWMQLIRLREMDHPHPHTPPPTPNPPLTQDPLVV